VFSKQDSQWMELALTLARKAAEQGEVPVGAVLVNKGEIIAQAYNQPITLNDPSAHAEMLVLRQAAEKQANYRLVNSELFVTLEPCMMCAGALVHARVKRLVFASREPKAGAVCSHLQALEQTFLNHKVVVQEGLLAEQSAALLSGFFKSKRDTKKSK
jgi:tRNA(adenine34) deaminase